jgi:hypothetical protein
MVGGATAGCERGDGGVRIAGARVGGVRNVGGRRVLALVLVLVPVFVLLLVLAVCVASVVCVRLLLCGRDSRQSGCAMRVRVHERLRSSLRLCRL